MTLADAEKNYSAATIMSMLDLVTLESQSRLWLNKHPNDIEVKEQLEAIELIKNKRLGNETNDK